MLINLGLPLSGVVVRLVHVLKTERITVSNGAKCGGPVENLMAVELNCAREAALRHEV